MSTSTITVTVERPAPRPITVAVQKASDGKSAYQSYLDTTTDDPPLSEDEWSTPIDANPTYSATPPSNHTNPWFDTTTGIISIWYVDAWIAINATIAEESSALTLGGNTLTFTGETLTFGT